MTTPVSQEQKKSSVVNFINDTVSLYNGNAFTSIWIAAMKSIRKPMIICFCIFPLGCTIGDTSNQAVQTPVGKAYLAPCPKSPNCVSSMEPNEKHYIPPLRYTGKKEIAYRKLVDMIESDKRAWIIAKQANYLKVEFRSAIFKFMGDVEFFFPSNLPVIEVRSASRVGYYDFGMNRKRIEDIRKRWK
jgi:uncharacterized protein (DUF1499 family)